MKLESQGTLLLHILLGIWTKMYHKGLSLGPALAEGRPPALCGQPLYTQSTPTSPSLWGGCSPSLRPLGPLGYAEINPYSEMPPRGLLSFSSFLYTGGALIN